VDAAQTKARILVVDDDRTLLEIYADLLAEAGYAVETASSGPQAMELIGRGVFDTILTDIVMPDTSGVEILRAVRARDLDVPVILVTGSPTVGTAIQALEMGALRYLVKPVQQSALLATVEHAVRLKRLAELKREALTHVGALGKLVGDRAGLEAVFSRALATLWLSYQPIVRADDGAVFGYEALLRTDEGNVAGPLGFLETAERLGRMVELGRGVREQVARSMAREGGEHVHFVNLHPAELGDPELYSPQAALTAHAKRVVLELTERASLESVRDLRERIRDLKGLGFRLAVDDVGVGYAGLANFAALEPDLVKLDRALVQAVDREPLKRRLVGAITRLCREMGIKVVGEGVETPAERDALVELGCDLLQGNFLSPPARRS
jgi:EAL domain-containing protein (putative c-di-GMP-specific phosphodiesterase class I)